MDVSSSRVRPQMRSKAGLMKTNGWTPLRVTQKASSMFSASSRNILSLFSRSACAATSRPSESSASFRATSSEALSPRRPSMVRRRSSSDRFSALALQRMAAERSATVENTMTASPNSVP